jgi:hypothetical protein
VRESTSAVTDLPFTVRETAAICASSDSRKTSLLQDGSQPFTAFQGENATILPVF